VLSWHLSDFCSAYLAEVAAPSDLVVEITFSSAVVPLPLHFWSMPISPSATLRTAARVSGLLDGKIPE